MLRIPDGSSVSFAQGCSFGDGEAEPTAGTSEQEPLISPPELPLTGVAGLQLVENWQTDLLSSPASLAIGHHQKESLSKRKFQANHSAEKGRKETRTNLKPQKRKEKGENARRAKKGGLPIIIAHNNDR
jgi:hypothetical protein